MKSLNNMSAVLENLFDKSLKMYIDTIDYTDDGEDYQRFWISLGDETILNLSTDGTIGAFDLEAMKDTLREYLNTPIDDLPVAMFADDIHGVTDILKAADRRIGKRRIKILQDEIENPIAKRIIEMRLHRI